MPFLDGVSMKLSYFLIPFLSALIGWLTNWLAIRMLFRPRDPKRMLGMKIQGLIPARQVEIADKLGELVEKELLTPKDISLALEGLHLEERLASQVDKLIDDKVNNATYLIIPLRKMLFLRAPLDMLVAELKKNIRLYIQREIPQMADEIAREMGDNIQIKEIVRQKIEDFELGYLEEIVIDLSRKELRAIEYLGGILGFVIGLVQIGVILIF